MSKLTAAWVAYETYLVEAYLNGEEIVVKPSLVEGGALRPVLLIPFTELGKDAWTSADGPVRMRHGGEQVTFKGPDVMVKGGPES